MDGIERHRENVTESTEEKVGEGVGTVTGALAGAGLGSAAGPIGTILGGIAGAVGGWWAGEKIGRSLDDWTDHEPYYRKHFESSTRDIDDYDTARVGYGVGHIAARNPEFRGRSFDEVEPTLRDHWTTDEYEYDKLRPYVREGYGRVTRD